MPRFPISDDPAPTLADKLRMALDLAEAGVDVMRENLRRRHPGETDAEIEARVVAWLHERPGAEHGDGVGRPNPGRFPSQCGRSPQPKGESRGAEEAGSPGQPRVARSSGGSATP